MQQPNKKLTKLEGVVPIKWQFNLGKFHLLRFYSSSGSICFTAVDLTAAPSQPVDLTIKPQTTSIKFQAAADSATV